MGRRLAFRTYNVKIRSKGSRRIKMIVEIKIFLFSRDVNERLGSFFVNYNVVACNSLLFFFFQAG